MPVKMANTVAEAAAQVFTLPADLQQWRACAELVNGYKIAEELGFDLIPWGGEQARLWRATGIWSLNLLELRLMLFWTFRADHMSGYTYHEHDDMADSLLRAISVQTGLPYPVKQEDDSDGEK